MKILLVGNSPLPSQKSLIRPAAGLRTYQFLRVLNGLERVELATVLIDIPGYGDFEESHMSRVLNISKNDPDIRVKIQNFHNKFEPDVIVSVNTYPSYLTVQLCTDAIIWCDLNGWIMAEAQAQANKMGGDDYLAHYDEMEMAILSRGDKFSTVSVAQKFAVIGELAGLGRLNSATFGYEFVECLQNGTEWFEGEREADRSRAVADRSRAVAVKLSTLPNETFVLLWMGGYNTWVDEDTLFNGVEKAMRNCKNLFFVSTGGEITGLDNKTYAKFKKMVEFSEFKNRFLFLGWVDSGDIPYVYVRANVGLNVDFNCVETLTGARNRINEMMKFGLPVITTLGSEISHEVVRHGAGVGVKSGDSVAFGRTIKEMYEDWEGGGEKLKNYSNMGSTYIEKFCNYKKILEPFLKWLECPVAAPDRFVKVNFGKIARLKGFWTYLRENGFRKSFKKLLQKIKSARM